MTVVKAFISTLALIILSSCRSKELSKNEHAWMPYKGNEILVFQSNTGETDTIFFLKKDTLKAYPEAQNPFGVTYEVVSIFCRHSDPSPPDGNHRYLENYFFELHKSKDGRGSLRILLAAKDAWFYRLSDIKIDSLSNIKPATLRTKYGQFNDVYVINGEDYLNLYNRSNFIPKLYWSKSQGLMRYDKKENIHWELANKYSP